MIDRFTLVITAAALVGAILPRTATAAPAAVPAYYFFDTNLGDLQRNSYNHGRYFAQHNPGGNGLLILDYGAARNVSGVWGVQSLYGGAQIYFTNAQVLSAMEYAADGVHAGYTTGSTIVAYGNNNSYMTSHGMTSGDAWNAGFYQSRRAHDLAEYQSSHGYNKQSAAIAQDQEPGFDRPGISKQLTAGATADGYALNWDYGSADGCPQSGDTGSCANGWTVGDVGYVSYSGSAVALPEIYYASPDMAAQWTVVRKWWNNNHSTPPSYTFWGSTGSTGVQLTPAQGWNRLNSYNPGVGSQLVCFGCGG